MQRPDSKSRSRVRPAAPRGLSTDSVFRASTPGAEILLDGPVDSSAVNLLSDLLKPPKPALGNRRNTSNLSRVMTNNELLDEIDNQMAFNSGVFEEQDEENLPQRHGLPWYRQPSPWWLIIGTSLAAMAMSTTLAPKVELYTKLVCRELRPEFDMIALQVSAINPIDWPPRLGAVTLPRPSERCQGDPGVHKAIATLGATIATVTGVLSCFTAGYWGQFSDRYGRTLVLAITVSGVLLTDLILILVAHFGQSLPFGYRFILIASIVEGLLGGISSGGAAGHAYIADCTNPSTRSRYLSLSMGLLFVGFAVGPTLGGLLISETGDLLVVYYLAASIHVVYLVSMLFIVPESLSKEEMANNREAYAEKTKRELEKERRGGSGIWYWCWTAIKRAFFFLKPLAVFLPRKRAGTQRGSNWNLTFLMISYSLVALVMGSYQYKLQYGSFSFGWNSQQLGYWLSSVGVLRATHLVVVLPLIMKLFNKQSAPTPGGGSPASVVSETSSIATSVESNPNRPRHTPTFDLLVARASALIEGLAYVGAALSTSPTTWVAATLFASLGTGFAPSVQALALELHQEAEDEEALSELEEPLDGGDVDHPSRPSTSTRVSVATTAAKATAPSSSVGAIYGAMGVIQALCTQILGPQIFGWTFVATIETLPGTIFWLGAGMLGAAFAGMMLIRLVDPRTEDTERGPGEGLDESSPLLVGE